jgi:hypothetical protein
VKERRRKSDSITLAKIWSFSKKSVFYSDLNINIKANTKLCFNLLLTARKQDQIRLSFTLPVNYDMPFVSCRTKTDVLCCAEFAFVFLLVFSSAQNDSDYNTPLFAR